MGARASVPEVIATQDDPFVFDRILFGDDPREAIKLGTNVEEVLKSGSGITSDPVIGKTIYETFSEDGKITKYHGGNAVKDVYRRDGTATFLEDAADPIYDKKISPITTAIDDLDFIEKKGKELNVKLPKLKSIDSASAPTTARIDSTPPPSGSTMKPVGTQVPADEVTRAAKPAIVEDLNHAAKAAASATEITPEALIDETSKPSAKISSDTATGSGSTKASGVVSGAKTPAPSAKTASKLADSLDLAKNAVKGQTNARNLLIAGAASIVGLGYYGRNKNRQIEQEYE
jgi:hypothetical protein